MNWLKSRIGRFLKAEDGPTTVEYAMMVMLIFLACISAVVSVGQSTSQSFDNSGQQLTESMEHLR
ncbi:MAG: Flp family type IVb pilin [Patescibacteria group bacterium]|nr:Flp family type IVb pilin [Patescibacteria group bacterium]